MGAGGTRSRLPPATPDRDPQPGARSAPRLQRHGAAADDA
eukprot:CAMPEP_0175801598 /NCGR_PEP_ID=MMETSP0097-20121207/87610_1 /TAXON_ID=311494 /ORGANISM="Alexandrium monilatum, Strain CCMP3105" /LENGTH=39 /DNA_ID= /DNA_START= /DNA_END= /DNA_ORIENTATION=